ncbi:hypothetical protein [Pedococcus bigeumensis]|uniref:hypothetical protein n=1 Tax=Pedococcus bigeumensis TaxID=433644 RepID=UPI0031E301D1
MSINERLSLDQFTVSDASPAPFEEFQVTWAISAASANVDVADYQFRLRTHYQILDPGLPTQGTVNTAIRARTLLSLQAKHTGSGTWHTLGQAISMGLDESTCTFREFPGALLDELFSTQVEQHLAAAPELWLAGAGVQPSWHTTHVEYKIPITMVLDNYFNGDLDIVWKLHFGVEYDSRQECQLDVSISSAGAANFSWYEDLLSLGSSAIIAGTVERLMPAILRCVVRDAERAIASGLCAYLDVGNFLDEHRLLSVQILPSGNINTLRFVLCEPPVGPAERTLAPKRDVAFDQLDRMP